MGALYSALYYPDTSIQDPSLLKTSLLLWDSVTTIAPWPGFQPDYKTQAENDAWEVVGRVHSPTAEEQDAVHEAVAEFVEGPILSEFLYGPASMDSEEIYEIYPQKLLPRTVELLRSKNLMGGTLPNSDLPATQWMGLHLLNILADCCAGDQMARITDEQEAYQALAGLMAEKTVPSQPDNAREAVVSVTLDVLNLASVEIDALVEFRRREESESRGRDYRQLRHRYCDRIEEQVKSLRASRGEAERKAIREKFREDMQEDIRLLRGELRSNAFQTGLSYMGVASTVLVVGYEAAAHFGLAPAVGGTLTPTAFSTATSAVTGLLMLRSKFAQSRAEVVRKHAMSYLYALKH
jgi:hypothetical protein